MSLKEGVERKFGGWDARRIRITDLLLTLCSPFADTVGRVSVVIGWIRTSRDTRRLADRTFYITNDWFMLTPGVMGLWWREKAICLICGPW